MAERGISTLPHRSAALSRFLASGRSEPTADRCYGVGVAPVSSGVAIPSGVAIVMGVAIIMGVAIVIGVAMVMGVAIGVAACIAAMSIVGSATTPQA